MATRTSELAVMTPGRWGFTKVRVFGKHVRITEDQDLVLRGECFIDSKGKLWEFYARKDDTIRAYPIKL